MPIDTGLRPNDWSVEHRPAVNTAATISRTALTGQRHVCTSITATLVAGTTAPAAVQVDVVLRDGASGAGTVLWSARVALEAVAGKVAPPIVLPGLNIEGSINTAMTLEFTAAGGGNTFEGVSMQGYDTADG